MYAGVDCGTQSTKVVIVDTAQGVIGEASHARRLDEGEGGRREQHPAEWVEALCSAFEDAIIQAKVDPCHRRVRSAARHGRT